MGTSSSYSGPPDNGAIAPDLASPTGGDASSPPSRNPKTPVEPPPRLPNEPGWGATKSLLTRFGNSGGGRTDAGRRYLREASSRFVSGQGGARQASRASTSGRASAKRLGSFLGTVATMGAAAAVDQLGLSALVGQSAEILLSTIVDKIAPAGAYLEDAVARAATTETLSELFRERAIDEGGIEGLDGLTAIDIREVLERFVAHYIYERLLQALARTLETRPARDIVRLENDVWQYVQNVVRLDLTAIDVVNLDWSGDRAHRLVDQIFREAYGIIEAE